MKTFTNQSGRHCIMFPLKTQAIRWSSSPPCRCRAQAFYSPRHVLCPERALLLYKAYATVLRYPEISNIKREKMRSLLLLVLSIANAFVSHALIRNGFNNSLVHNSVLGSSNRQGHRSHGNARRMSHVDHITQRKRYLALLERLWTTTNCNTLAQ